MGGWVGGSMCGCLCDCLWMWVAHVIMPRQQEDSVARGAMAADASAVDISQLQLSSNESAAAAEATNGKKLLQPLHNIAFALQDESTMWCADSG